MEATICGSVRAPLIYPTLRVTPQNQQRGRSLLSVLPPLGHRNQLGNYAMDKSDNNSRPASRLEGSATNTVSIERTRLESALVQMLQTRARKGTGPLNPATRSELPILTGNPFGLMQDSPARVLRLPKHGSRKSPTWLVELYGFGGNTLPVRIEIAGDMVLGVVRRGQELPDFDLNSYCANEKGVSRRHALLRPSRNRLFIIDLQSTNGTRVNALPVGAGIARELHNYDVISLGALTFSIKILATAADYEAARAKRVRTIL